MFYYNKDLGLLFSENPPKKLTANFEWIEYDTINAVLIFGEGNCEEAIEKRYLQMKGNKNT